MIYTNAVSFTPKSPLSKLFKNTGVSKEANILQKNVENALTHLYDNESMGSWLREARGILQEIAEEHNEPNWDGYNALPVNENSLYRADEFLRMLPLNVSLPNIDVDPDGEVSFDWYNDSDDVFSISIGETGRLAFAGMFGPSEVHGVEYFNDEIPKPILLYLKRVSGLM